MRLMETAGHAVAHTELNANVVMLKATSSGLLETLDQFLDSAIHREEVQVLILVVPCNDQYYCS
jgi:hypothetical protein